MTQAYKRWCTGTINTSIRAVTILRNSQDTSVNNARNISYLLMLLFPLPAIGNYSLNQPRTVESRLWDLKGAGKRSEKGNIG